MNESDFRNYVAQGVVQGGMIPKLENAFQAIAAGVKEVVITKASIWDKTAVRIFFRYYSI